MNVHKKSTQSFQYGDYFTFIAKAIGIIKDGVATKIESSDKCVTVYKVKDIIRIDWKNNY